VCDVEKRLVDVLDLKNKTFSYLTKDRRLVNPVNICIHNGVKYIADSIAGTVFVFGADNQLKAILGKDLDIKPIDMAVRGNRCYVTDMKSNQVVVIDIATGTELLRMGAAGDGTGQFGLIADVALDADENVYVTDKGLAKINKFDKDGVFQMAFGQIGDSIHDFVRPKGIAVDKAGRIWVVDAAPEVAKIYNPEGQLMMFFGFPGGELGNMNLPAAIIVDYDHVDLFKEDFAEGAQIEFLVLVTNQYVNKINIYGFGQFPVQEKMIQETTIPTSMSQQPDEAETEDQTVPDSE
jgi:DNA-binding beta-propeller fold protein YncE